MIRRREFLAGLLAPPPREFRRKFTDTAEEIAWMPAPQRPRQIVDCSSYLRYCYLQATGERGNIFYVSESRKAEFADAEHLMRFNTRRLSPDLASARPADLFFFRQLELHQPWHAMIFLGASRFEPGTGSYLAYHTGPDGKDPGEIRRPSLDELLRHPEPRWRPVSGNRNFLGVFRWNILY